MRSVLKGFVIVRHKVTQSRSNVFTSITEIDIIVLSGVISCSLLSTQ